MDRLHFDEAWYGYARFNPIYAKRFAMHGEPGEQRATARRCLRRSRPTSCWRRCRRPRYIHVRDGRRPIDHARFNEAFMMHASTSPQYAIIASNDIAAAMMDGPSGEALTGEFIREAVAFRQTLARLEAEFQARGDWFFNAWQPDTVADARPARRRRSIWPTRRALAHDPSMLGAASRRDVARLCRSRGRDCMLDPIKVSVVTPGMGRDGKLLAKGIPASLLAAYLDAQGIVVEKTTDFTSLFLFSLGVTRGKWGTLINALLGFHRDILANTPLTRASRRSRRPIPRNTASSGSPTSRKDVRCGEDVQDNGVHVGGLRHSAGAGSVSRGGL